MSEKKKAKEEIQLENLRQIMQLYPQDYVKSTFNLIQSSLAESETFCQCPSFERGGMMQFTNEIKELLLTRTSPR